MDDRAGGPRRPPRPGRAEPVPSPYDDPDVFSAEPARATAPNRAAEPEHDYVDLPPESRIPRGVAALLVIGLIVVIVAGIGWWWYQRQVDPPGPQGEAVQVEVPDGSSTGSIADLLAARDIVSNGTLFNLYIGRKDAGPFQAGTYELHRNSSFDEALAELEEGPDRPLASKDVKVTIPEGYTVAKILQRIHEKVPRMQVERMRAALDQGKVPSSLKPEGTRSYEGLLFPATYEVGPDTTEVELLTTMAQEMESRVEQLGLEQARSRIKETWGLDLTGYDLLKIASMIQYEAAGPAESPKIATVIDNRLRDGMPLGVDATSRYEASLNGGEPDFESDSAYNTRKNAGLPPTPIAAPGEAALGAAFQPAVGDWLYYVLTSADAHTFTTTYQDFLDAKAICKEKGLGCG